MKYRKRLASIDAFQIGHQNVPTWFTEYVRTGRIISSTADSALMVTDDGVKHAKLGDYVIRGVYGELSVMNPDAFVLMYELAE